MGRIGTAEVETLAASTCWELLRTTAVGRLALRGDRDIEIFPVNYIVDHGSIVVTSADGLKADLVRAGNRGTFEADDVEPDNGSVWSVVAKGTPEIVQRHDELVAAFSLEISTWQPGPKPLFIRLVPDIVTGRRFVVESAPRST